MGNWILITPEKDKVSGIVKYKGMKLFVHRPPGEQFIVVAPSRFMLVSLQSIFLVKDYRNSAILFRYRQIFACLRIE